MVTQVTGSYTDLYRWDNLYAAWRKAAKGKRSRSAAARFEYRLEDNRVGKGIHRALDTCQQWAQRYPYVLQCDVRQFFPSIDHALLRQTLDRRIQDGAQRRLIALIVASGVGVLSEQNEMVYFRGDDLFAVNRPRGLPIGNLTNQFWANCYLNSFDHFVNRTLGCSAYLRYVDDMLLFGDSKAQLRGPKAGAAASRPRLM